MKVGSEDVTSDSASDSSRKQREEIGARLEQARGDITQKEWAALLGLPLKTYTNYARGIREPDLRTWIGLIDRGWNINWLLTGEGPERVGAEKQGVSSARLDPEMMQKAVESAIGVFQRFNKLPSASQLARASVLLYLLFTDSEPETAQPVDQLLARIMGEPADAEPSETPGMPGFTGF